MGKIKAFLSRIFHVKKSNDLPETAGGEDKEKSSRVRTALSVAIGAAALITAGAVIFVRINRDFDAKTFVAVTLDYFFKGGTEQDTDIFTPEDLKRMKKGYEENIASFTKNEITGSADMDAGMRDDYEALCEEIFAAMKYEAVSAKRLSMDRYEVKVKYRQCPVILTYRQASLRQTFNIADKVEKGEYQGKDSGEINRQITGELLDENYELLRDACRNMEYWDEKYRNFTVSRGENGDFSVSESEMADFLVEILLLDALSTGY